MLLCWGRRLWNISQDNMSCLKGDKARPRAPDLAQLLAPVILEMDPEEEVEEQYKVGRLFRPLPRAALRLRWHGMWS